VWASLSSSPAEEGSSISVSQGKAVSADTSADVPIRIW
jgi:hypothetical protein